MCRVECVVYTCTYSVASYPGLLTSHLMCLIKLIIWIDLGIRWPSNDWQIRSCMSKLMKMLTMGSHGNAPCIQKATPEPYNVQLKSEAIENTVTFSQASSICMLAVVTPRNSALIVHFSIYSCGVAV